MFQELPARAEAHKALNLKLEQTRGSGYHDDDVDPTTQHLHPSLWRKVAPQHQRNEYSTDPNAKLPRLSAHRIAYFDHEFEEAVYLVGPDAEAALVALQAWCKKNAPKEVHSPMPGTYRKILKHVPRLAVNEMEGVPVLKLWLSEWNDFLYALLCEGVGITGAPLEPDGTTP